jgi:hypothetical protein
VHKHLWYKVYGLRKCSLGFLRHVQVHFKLVALVYLLFEGQDIKVFARSHKLSTGCSMPCGFDRSVPGASGFGGTEWP